MQNYDQAAAYVAALAGVGAMIDVRMIHDTDKAVPAIPMRGTLDQLWPSICHYNTAGYGAFCCINDMDGLGRENGNVRACRAHVIDADDPDTSAQTYQSVQAAQPAAGFAVTSSPGKFHAYWPVQPYADLARYTLVQRKLIAAFRSDPRINDAARVLRMPGTYHLKSTPFLVTCHALPGFGQRGTVEALEAALAHVSVTGSALGGRQELGSEPLSAPSYEWALSALFSLDPNAMDRGEWIAVTSSFKQAAWLHASPEQIEADWSRWCAQYGSNNLGENAKQWKSIRDTEIGWSNLMRRNPNTQAIVALGDPSTTPAPVIPVNVIPPASGQAFDSQMPTFDSEMLTANEQTRWFKDCTFITRLGEIWHLPLNRSLSPGQFNVMFGGKKFIKDNQGKVTDEAWNAATRSTIWTIPKADHIRFVPTRPPGDLIIDDLGRYGLNTYIPSRVVRRPGDVTPFLRHMEHILPSESDRKLYLDFLAHNAKFPGHKIPWAPLIQSAEGAGKGAIKRIISHIMGASRVYFPNAMEMAKSGAKFNSWMRNRLFILVDEVRTDERRDMIEVLKPMISEAEIEIEGKGENQEKEDNYSNWAFFSNFKDAIPVNANGRRFAIFYSAIQSVEDLQARGMDQAYFDRFYTWLDVQGGKEFVADWLIERYPLELGGIPMRAPSTTSTTEALEQSRGPLELFVSECVEDGRSGFKGGWVSTLALMQAAKSAGHSVRNANTLHTVLTAAGYHRIGRASRAFFQENAGNGDINARGVLYHKAKNANVEAYGSAQGYT